MRRRVLSVHLASLALLALVAPPCAAQGDGVAAELQGGGAWLREGGIPQTGVGTLGGSLQRVWRRGAVAATSLGACATDLQCTAQGIATAAVYAPPDRWARWEASVTGSGFALQDALPVTSGQVELREYLGGALYGGFAGVSGGIVHSGVTGGASSAEAGGWWRVRGEQLDGGARFMRVPVTPVLSDGSLGPPLSGRATFTDLWAAWQHDDAFVSLGATAGWRLGSSGGVGGGGWATLSATRWLTPQLGVAVAAGRAIEDPTRGTPAARYLSLALRVRLQPPAARSAPRRERAAGGPVVTVVATDDSARSIEVRAPDAASVEIMADFTDWNPVTLVRDGDRWTLVRRIAPGPHRIAVRIDGGEWQPPANVPTVHDDFGGSVGLITVP